MDVPTADLEELREVLILRSYLFEDPGAYEAGVLDALDAVVGAEPTSGEPHRDAAGVTVPDARSTERRSALA